MANVRNLKKDINYVLGDIIEAVYIWESANPDKDRKKSEAIIDEAIATFDDLIEKVNAKLFLFRYPNFIIYCTNQMSECGINTNVDLDIYWKPVSWEIFLVL